MTVSTNFPFSIYSAIRRNFLTPQIYQVCKSSRENVVFPFQNNPITVLDGRTVFVVVNVTKMVSHWSRLVEKALRL